MQGLSSVCILLMKVAGQEVQSIVNGVTRAHDDTFSDAGPYVSLLQLSCLNRVEWH